MKIPFIAKKSATNTQPNIAKGRDKKRPKKNQNRIMAMSKIWSTNSTLGWGISASIVQSGKIHI
jgi:hypothetical protein